MDLSLVDYTNSIHNRNNVPDTISIAYMMAGKTPASGYIDNFRYY